MASEQADPLLQIQLEITAPEIIAGGEFPVLVRLLGTMPSGGVLVASRQADHPFHYHFLGQDGKELNVSRDIYLRVTKPHPSPPRAQDVAALRAASVIEYTYDLSRVMTQTLAPGTYQLRVSYPFQGKRYMSEAVSVTVAPARVLALEHAPNGNRYVLGSALIHLNAADKPVLYQRESLSGHPEIGTYRARVELVEMPASLALSTDGESTTEPRWIGWTASGEARFIQVWGAALLHTTAGVAVGPEARLISPGWTFDDETVSFLGVSRAGFALVTVPGREQPHVQTFAGLAVPETNAIVRASAIRTPSGERRILAVWSDGGRVMASILNPNGEAIPARVLTERQEPVVALEVESVALEGAPAVASIHSDGSEAFLVQVRPGGQVTATTINPLPDGSVAQEWLVRVAPRLGVLARVDTSRILSWDAASQSWRAVLESTETIEHVRLLGLQQLWLACSTRERGIHYLQLATL